MWLWALALSMSGTRRPDAIGWPTGDRVPCASRQGPSVVAVLATIWPFSGAFRGRTARGAGSGAGRWFCVGGCCPGVLKDFGDDQNLLAHDWGAGLLADAPRARAAAWRDAVSCKTRSAAVSVNATFKGRAEISPLAGLECGPGDGVNAPVAAA